ncbi:class I SAM-dependent methyltransferase [Nodularia sp. UHCC 0506]|uniref:class I SAM-dependent methyltransferase n=1 Tax=Nodularia sp. UHCC 0506 TaxID=3110243 RepID=UPI002B1F99FC|nr:class I SAM-dependent methyltransferase [Nodularia sp. UHCC 0506]MEA5515706.1 class I SAM-dependent methyltransferase [Nodularia sp. UHCC 0506]
MKKPEDARQYAPATERNRQPILKVLLQVLPTSGTILEVASGTGEHAVFFAPRLSPRRWLPTEQNPLLRASVRAWAEECPSDHLYPPLELDASAPIWALEQGVLLDSPIVAIVNINMIHISPWSACLGLMAGAGRILPPGGILYLYGPFKQKGEHTAPSNAAFDQSLTERNPEWGVRNLEDVIAAASNQNLTFKEIYQMPANNLSVVFQRGE